MKSKYLINIFLLFSLILKSQSNEVEKKPTYFGLDFLKISFIDSVGSPEIRPFEIRILQAFRRGRHSKRITNFKTENYEENKIYRSTNRKGAQTA